MKKITLKYICLYALFVLMSAPAWSQSPILENQVMIAVNKMDKDDYAGAKLLLEQVLAADDNIDAAWYYLSKIAINDNDSDTAEACLLKAVSIDPKNFWYRHTLARLFALTDRPELSISMYEDLLRDFPKNSDLYFDLIEFYASQQELQKALDVLGEIEKEFGMTESIAIYRYNLLRVMGKQDEAIESLKDYNTKYSSPFVLSSLAENEMSSYNDSTALVYYNEALDLAPDYAPALLGKAEAYRMTLRHKEYFPALYKYMETPEETSEAKADYVMAVMRHAGAKFIRSFQEQLDSAIVRLYDAHPKDSTAIRTAALYFYSTSRDDRADVYFKENVDRYPSSYVMHVDYVEFLMYTDRWEELSSQGRKSFERFPGETAFLEMAGMGDYNLGEYEKVLDVCQKVIETAPKDSSTCLRTYSTMGDVYHELGRKKDAYQAYERALKINPDYVYVLNNYAYFLSEDGKKLKKACAMSAKTIEVEPNNATYLDTYAWILHLLGRSQEAKPLFKRAMLYGGKDSSVILDHYAEVLYALEEYEMAFIYWNLALQKKDERVPGLEEKVQARREAVKK